MPTHLIRGWVAELAKKLRNQPDYDDFEYGTEVIPGDKTWVKHKGNICRMESKKEKA
jgi:hypothetical protein